MKAISSNIVKTLSTKSKLVCADNSGAKVIEIIAVMGFKGRRRKLPSGGVADVISCKVRMGNEKVMHEVHKAIIIRQRKEYRRADGLRISFEDNAAVLVNITDNKVEPKGTLIKGPVAREVVERFPTIGKISSIVV